MNDQSDNTLDPKFTRDEKPNSDAGEQPVDILNKTAESSPFGAQNQGSPTRNYRTKIGQHLPRDALPERTDAENDMISVQDVLNTANLNDRMEMARLRHAQILAQRSDGNVDDKTTVASVTGDTKKDTVRIALAGRKRNTKEIEPATAKTTSAKPVKATASVAAAVATSAKIEGQRRRRGVLYATAAVIVLLVGVALPGPFRDYAGSTISGLLGADGGSQIADAPNTPPDPISTVTVLGSVALGLANMVAPPSDIEPTNGDGQLFSAFTTVAGPHSRPSILRTPSQDTRPNPALGVAVPKFSQLSTTTELTPVAGVTDLSGPSLLANIPTELAPPEIAAPSISLTLQPTAGQGADRPLFASLAETSVQGVAPNSAVGEIVSNYILKDFPTPVAMAVYPQSWELPAIVLPPDTAQNLPEKFIVQVVRLPVAAALNAPQTLRQQVVPQPVEPVRIGAVQLSANVAVSPLATPSLNVSLPVETEIPPRHTMPTYPVAVRVDPASNIVPEAPAPYVAKPGGSGFQLTNLSMNAPSSFNKNSLEQLVQDLRSSGFPANDPNIVNFTVSRTNVRFFHASDTRAAQAVADAVGGVARDFTSFRPTPPLGTIEVWMAGTPIGQRPRSATSAPSRSTGTDPALQLLRNRLLESLRNGDHL